MQEHSRVTLSCSAIAHPPPTWTWKFNGTLQQNVSLPSLTTTLTITSAVAAESGTYSCTAFNPFGSKSGESWSSVLRVNSKCIAQSNKAFAAYLQLKITGVQRERLSKLCFLTLKSKAATKGNITPTSSSEQKSLQTAMNLRKYQKCQMSENVKKSGKLYRYTAQISPCSYNGPS